MPTLTQPAIGSTAWGTQMNTNLQVLQNQLTNAMQGRIALVSTTQIALQRYSGDTVEVNGLNVSMGASGITLNTTDNLITSTGADAGAAMAGSTLYYIYVSNSAASPFASSLRASTTQPPTPVNGLNGVRYLGNSGNAANWRFVGYARTNGTTQFVDSVTQRFVVNYYNRVPKDLFSCPGYVNDNTQTTYSVTGGNWSEANSGTGSKVEFIANGEESVHYDGHASGLSAAGDAVLLIGVGEDSSSGPAIASYGHTAAANYSTHGSCSRDYFPSEGYHYLDLLLNTNAVSITIIADMVRAGGASDPAVTYIAARIHA
jgi:hypothetical protein